jgi:hypothetical protein
LQGQLSPSNKIDVARVAYALGDDADARSAVSARAHGMAYSSYAVLGASKKHKKKKHAPKPTPTRKATPTPKPTAAPTFTATPRPISLPATLQSGVAAMSVHSSGGATPSFSWQPVAGATRYVVIVSSSGPVSLAWTWSGTSTSVQFGDTSLPGLSGSDGEVWPLALPAGGYTWSVLALDAGGHIIGLALRGSA